MRELLKNAWSGWQNYTDSGKLAALLFAALLFLWFAGKTDRRKGFFGYTAVMAVCCVFPLSAAALMMYQTKFYDYVWIWSLVPLTAVTAWGFVEFLTHKKIGESRMQRAGIGILAVTVLFLCGNLGKESVDFQAEKRDMQGAEQVISTVSRAGQGKELCLLAPQNIMEYARVLDGKLRLPYGRNMWEHSLNGYSYDEYPAETVNLYQWMCSLEELGDFDDALAIGMVYGRNMWEHSLNGYSYDEYPAETVNLYQWMCSLEELGDFDDALAIGMVTAEAYEPMRDACLQAADKNLDTALEKGVNCFLFPGGLKKETTAYLTGLLQEKAGSGISAELIAESSGNDSFYLMIPTAGSDGKE